MSTELPADLSVRFAALAASLDRPVNWVIEQALRALRLAYAGRIRCILIDPPYNTGNRDFVYNDHFVGQNDRYRQNLWRAGCGKTPCLTR